MLDYLYDMANGRPAYIDANPRIGETVNATLSGLNLCELLVQVSRGGAVAPPGNGGSQGGSIRRPRADSL